MKVVHISRYNTGDGAANAAYRLHRGLLYLGHDSIMFVAQIRGEANDPTVVRFRPPMDLLSRVRRRLRHERISRSLVRYRTSRPAEGFSDDRVSHGSDVLAQLPRCDVINIHSMYHFVDFQTFIPVVPQHTAVVRTMHDMSFFTGGCHVDAGCGKYADRCGACPQLDSQESEDLSRQIWQRKYMALNGVKPERLCVVAPSLWLAKEARRSSLLQNLPVVVIPHGVDTEVFSPRDRGVARDVLGVPKNARVVLFVSEPVTRRNKGFALLAEALNGRSTELSNLFLISLGSGKPPAEVRIPHLHLGHIADGRIVSLVYSAADVFVIPSLQENFPLTVLEAIACGIPVIGFAVGGIPDMVRHGVTGLLVPPYDVTDLRAAICYLLQDPRLRAEMSIQCRRVAAEEYTLELQARRYVELYRSSFTVHRQNNAVGEIGLENGNVAKT